MLSSLLEIELLTQTKAALQLSLTTFQPPIPKTSTGLHPRLSQIAKILANSALRQSSL